MAQRFESGARSSVLIAAAALLSTGVSASRPDEPGLYLFQVPTARETPDAGLLGPRIEADLHVPNPAYLAEKLGNTSVEVLAADAEVVRVAIGSRELVAGVMLIETDDQALAFGRAWAQIHDGQDWQIADATRPELESHAKRIRYLPLSDLGNEGPGYSLDIVQFSTVQPARVDNLRTSPN